MYFQFTAVVLAVLATATGINGADSSYCAICDDHTMCKYTGVSDACKPRITGGIPTAAEQTIILDVHNAERSKVAMGAETRGKPGPQPGAANMAKLVWNNEIATVAQRWADQCTFAHDSCRRVANSSVGQNIYMSMTTSTSTDSNWAAAVTAWINEVDVFNKDDVSPFKFSMETGHYTQVVWAATTAVGCGRTVFKDGSSKWTKQIYVCNYAVAGNLLGSNIYSIGSPCSQCPAGHRKCSTATAQDKGLCSY